MKPLLLAALAGTVTATATAYNADTDVKYMGFERNGIEVFLNIPYGQDTSGENRFKPPRPFIPTPGSTIDATKAGPACPQSLGMWNAPLTLNNITETSEDCLNLNIARPKNFDKWGYPLPVMVWIHGGSFWVGSNMEPTHQPDGLIIQSVENKYPVIHVAMNYRLGFFGFAQSEALKMERSENAGLRDQRAAIEWVRDHIAAFGGNPHQITIFGQSSGGLAVGMQLLAYGGEKPLPYQQGICESQALEPGITGNFSIDAMTKVIDHVGCNGSSNSSVRTPEVIACLRSKDTETLFNASFTTYAGDIAHNIGDIWLPSVDGDFLPAPPSQLINDGRFGKARYMIGWANDDVNFFTDVSIKTANDTRNFIGGYLPALPEELLDNELLKLYPVDEFAPPPGTNLTAEFYRSARIFRDIIMVCQPLYLAESMSLQDNAVYLYDWNQTILDPIIEAVYKVSGMGVVHTSEFAYIYGNLSHYNVSGYPFNPTQSDYQLLQRGSRTWSTFATTGRTEGDGFFPRKVLAGWEDGFKDNRYIKVFTIGGPMEGLWALEGPESIVDVRNQRLTERCQWINHPKIRPYLQY